MNALNSQERLFAERHHEIVWRFLKAKRLQPAEYYDIIIFRYLSAVQKYLSTPTLQEYVFDFVAWNEMRSALYCYRRSLNRKSAYISFLDIESVPYNQTDSSRNDAPTSFLWLKIKDSLSASEQFLVLKKCDRYFNREIAQLMGISPNAVKCRWYRLRKKLKTLIEGEKI